MDAVHTLDDILPVTTGSPDETRAVGRRIAGVLNGIRILALEGVLGAGKTELVRGIADGLGLDGDTVSSPTFTVVHEYRGGGTVLYHVDAYRIESEAELTELGIEDVLWGDGRCVVEWPERLGRLLPKDAAHILLEHVGDTMRRIAPGRIAS